MSRARRARTAGRTAAHAKMDLQSNHSEDLTMCMNCGCGEVDSRHQSTDITREDVQRAAEGSGITLDEATANIQSSLDKMGQSQEAQPAS